VAELIPLYITPAIKGKLRRKNRLMRAGRTEEASAVAQQIAIDIVLRNSAAAEAKKGLRFSSRWQPNNNICLHD